MEENPWIDFNINENGDYFLNDLEFEYVNQNNEHYQHNLEHDRYIDLRYLPEPFIGNVNAPIYFLAANPSRIRENEDQRLHEFNHNQFFIDTINNNLNHNEIEYPFYYLNPQFENTAGYEWWDKCLNPLIEYISEIVNLELDQLRQIFSTIFFAIEIHGYHSKKFSSRLLDIEPILPSIEYNRSLIQNAIQENKLILIGRSVRNWFGLIQELEHYDNCHFVANNRSMILSETTISPLIIHEIINIINGAQHGV